MHPNSLEAYDSIRTQLPKREWEVFRIIVMYAPVTRQEIGEHLFLPINCITGRVTKLIQKKLIAEYGHKKSPTGRRRAALKVTVQQTQGEMF